LPLASPSLPAFAEPPTPMSASSLAVGFELTAWAQAASATVHENK
jgi:hypothetical protein